MTAWLAKMKVNVISSVLTKFLTGFREDTITDGNNKQNTYSNVFQENYETWKQTYVILKTYTLSASGGRFLGTWVKPRCEQSTESPVQEHAHGHLVNSPDP